MIVDAYCEDRFPHSLCHSQMYISTLQQSTSLGLSFVIIISTDTYTASIIAYK